MSRARRSPWFKPVVAVAIAIGITLAAWAGLSANVFFATQLRLSDALFPGAEADPRIVVVEIDDRSIARVGQWPWDRDVHAELVDRLSADGARLIGYDVTFGSTSSGSGSPAEDEAFANAIREAGSVVLAETATFEGTPTSDVL
jgi:CHASE2 domain-containing sensor protein